MKYYLGMDMGTSSLKTVLVDEHQQVIRQSSNNYAVDQPQPGWKEINPEKWTEAAQKGIQDVLDAAVKDKIAGIGVTGQMHTTVFLDKDGKSIRPALMWNDTRTIDLVPRLKTALGDASDGRTIQRIVSTGSPAVNLFWLKINEPENWQALQHFVIGPDYLVHWLTGTVGTDYCEASTSSLYDVERKRWSSTMADFLGLTSGQYPPVRGAAQSVGKLKAEMVETLGLSPGIPVVAGTGDNVAAALAMGGLTNGGPLLSLGTSGVLMCTRKQYDFKAKGKHILYSINGEDFGYLVQGVVQSAGSSYDWLVKKILGDTTGGSCYQQVDSNQLGKGSLLFYPHLVGDKTLYQDPALRGAFIGLSTDVTRDDMVIAVMEGIAFAVRELAEAMNLAPSVLKVTGGGTKSNLWMQILADVLDCTIEPEPAGASAVVGAAMLAEETLNRIEKKEETVQKQFIPKKNNKKRYARKYEKYKKIYDALKIIN